MAHDTLYAIGEALIDMIPAETGCDFGAVSSFAPRVGGAPANVAAAFARLGGRSALLTQLGDDPFGAKITAELVGAGVDVSHIATTDRANTALAFVSLQADGNRTFSFYPQALGGPSLQPGAGGPGALHHRLCPAFLQCVAGGKPDAGGPQGCHCRRRPGWGAGQLRSQPALPALARPRGPVPHRVGVPAPGGCFKGIR